MMTDEERDLAGWQAEWSEIADLPAFERAIGARVVRDRRRLLGAAAGEVGGAAESVAAFVDLTRKRLATEIEWMRFAKRATTLLGLASMFWAAWALVEHFDQYAAQPWRAVVGFGGVALILGGLARWIPRTQARLTGELMRFDEVVGRAALDES